MYQTIVTGLDLGTKFLTENTAYNLGALLSGEKIVIENTLTNETSTYWIAPIRHNPTHYEHVDLEEHIKYIKDIASHLGKEKLTHMTDFLTQQGVKLPKFNAGKKGIVTLFKEQDPTYAINDFVSDIEQPLLGSDPDVIRAFLVGAFDGRSSYDKTAKYISLDFDSTVARDILVKALTILGINFNLNQGNKARKRSNGNSAPRKPQLRIKHLEFLEKIGFISVIRFKKATKDASEDYTVEVSNGILPGLKTLERKSLNFS